MAEPSYHEVPEDPSYDPRDIITPYAFEVDEELLGAELAAPSRRLWAMLLDLMIAAVTTQLGGVSLGLIVAFLFFRLATRQRIEQPLKRWARASLAVIGALVLFATVVSFVGSGGGNGDGENPAITSAERDSVRNATVDSVMNELSRQGISTEQLSNVPFMPRAVLDVMETAQQPDSMSAEQRDSSAVFVRQYAEALRSNDKAALDSLRPTVAALAAGSQITNLRSQLQRAEERIDDLEDRNDELAERANDPSLWRMARSTANDLGLTFGWIGVYFTLFLAWWNGYTPGKWLLGIRVLRLNGQRMSLWPAFERFGGYAASIATGLVGFAQIYWDPNRQGMHDRIAQTVVIRVRPTGNSSPNPDIDAGT